MLAGGCGFDPHQGQKLDLKHINHYILMADIRRFAMRMKLHKVGGSPVHHCALLCKHLAVVGISSTIVKGYCVTPGEICEHYWVRTRDEGLDLDVAFEMACLYTPDLKDINKMLLEQIPEEMKDVEIIKAEDSARLFELFTTDPKTFWDESPITVRSFH